MTRRFIRFLCLFLVLSLLLSGVNEFTTPRVIAQTGAQTVAAQPPWISLDQEGQPTLDFYYFYTPTCPYCRLAQPFVETLENDVPWVTVHKYDLSADPGHGATYQSLAAATGNQAQYVPAFIFYEEMIVGFDSVETTGVQMLTALEAHYTEAVAAQSQPRDVTPTEAPVAQLRSQPAASVDIDTTDTVAVPISQPAAGARDTYFTVPLLGAVQAQTLSLPLLTLVLAGLDAFNPCAFFVLLFLLSMVIHAQSRLRMAVIGGVFVFFSGALYFVFMAAWLNVFLWLGELLWITLAAGLLALVFGALNIKDYFFFKQGPSLSIPERAKPALFDRMRNLIRAGSWPALIAGTIVLAIAANSYELLCTAGFPMVFTRVLTLHAVATPVYYAYLLAYSLIYILPLTVIVALFTIRFSARKLSTDEGRILKLLSGLMMLFMGLILVFAPALMSRIEIAGGLLGSALVITFLLRRFGPGAPPEPKNLRPAA